jgi:tetratricopeptide (TPR) repeat protein
VLTPPVQSPDESHHLWRIYQLAEGRLVSELRGPGDPRPETFTHDTGGRLPAALFGPNLVFGPPDVWPSFGTLLSAFRIRMDPDDRRFLGFSNTAVTPPLVYVPPLVGMLAARLVTDSVVAYYFAGRVANLLVTTLLIALAIRVTPLQKWTFVLVGLTPTTLSLRASLSSDGPTLAIALLFVAAALRLAFDPSAPRRRGAAAVVVLAGALAFTRQVYFALAGLLLLVPHRRFGDPRRFAALIALTCAVLGALGLAWGRVVLDIHTRIHAESRPEAVARFLYDNPLAFASAALTTARELGIGQLHECMGALGLLDPWLPTTLVWIHGLVLILVGALDSAPSVRMRLWQRSVALGVALLTVLSIYGACLILWGEVGDLLIDVRGRYFLPIFPVALLPLYGLGAWIPSAGTWLRARLPLLVPFHLGVVLLVTVHVVGSYHYLRPSPIGAEAQRHRALGEAFLWSGQVEDAAREFRAVLEIDPSRPGPRYYLARIAAASGDVEGAIRGYRSLLRARPDLARQLEVPRRLAWLLATNEAASAEERDAAVSLAREQCGPGDCDSLEALDLLAAALAGAGRYAEAVSAAERALARAGDHPSGRRAAIESRLTLYRAGHPFRGPVDPEATPPRRILPDVLTPEFL